MNKQVILALTVGILLSLAVLPAVQPAFADKLSEAIAQAPQGTDKGQINPSATPGYLGIPGAISPSLIGGLLWAIWVGWIFSTVGVFGGIMAGVGHISESSHWRLCGGSIGRTWEVSGGRRWPCITSP